MAKVTNQTRVMIVKCELPAACSGGENSSCSEGYTSRQCGACQDGFFKFGEKCEKCSAHIVVLGLHGVLLLVAVLGTWFLLWLVMKDPRIGSPFAFVFRLLETLGILNLTLIRWPLSVGRFLNFVTLVNFNTEMFQTEVSCKLLHWTRAHSGLCCWHSVLARGSMPARQLT
jgi:hypothetical protein